MDKPTDCGLCPFEDFGYCNVKGERNTSEKGVDADCPLIEITDRKTEPSDSEIPNSSTISKMEQVDKDINVRSKTEPQKDCKKCENYDRCKNNRWKCCVYQPKDEPQTDYAWR